MVAARDDDDDDAEAFADDDDDDDDDEVEDEEDAESANVAAVAFARKSSKRAKPSGLLACRCHRPMQSTAAENYKI